MKKKVLFIGANSALAQEIEPYFSNYYDIITGGREYCDLHIDITKPFTIPASIDYVINFACFMNSSHENTEISIQTNILGTYYICMACKQANVSHLIHLSSISATYTKENPYYSLYSITKKISDEFCEEFAKQHNLNLTIIRPSQLYGKNKNFIKNQSFFYSLLKNVKENTEIKIYGNHDAIRNFVYASDVGVILKKILEKSITGTYNIVNPQDTTITDIINTASNILKQKSNYSFVTSKPNIPDVITPKDTILYSLIDYFPETSLTHGIQYIYQNTHSSNSP